MTERDYTQLFCCGCQKDVQARLTEGAEIYPHRKDLHDLPFWICDICRNYVGTHNKIHSKIWLNAKPLGNIPDKPMRAARGHIHRILDPIWKTQCLTRGKVYSQLSELLGYNYHTGEIKTLDEARRIYAFVIKIRKQINIHA